MEIKSEAMWIICSLACENKLSSFIGNETEILQSLKDLLNYYFINNYLVKG